MRFYTDLFTLKYFEQGNLKYNKEYKIFYFIEVLGEQNFMIP
jgi:hypothetical protein